jgi:hypothetical protein
VHKHQQKNQIFLSKGNKPLSVELWKQDIERVEKGALY